MCLVVFLRHQQQLERLKMYALICQLKKCHFTPSTVEYLGYILTGVTRGQTEKTMDIAEMKRPHNKLKSHHP